MFEQSYHYSVGNRKTADKLQAIIWAGENNEFINFHLPEWLQELPIHIEPEQDIKDLCKARAHQLRDSCNYLRLWFSGGCDSRYMLDIFLENKIHIDEIICMKSGVPEADWEIDQVALPYVDSIKHKIPHTKVVIKEPSWQDYKNWYSDPYWFEKYIKGKREGKAFFGIRLNEFHESVMLQNYQKGCANVLGLDKPFINYVNSEWFAYFCDTKLEFQQGDKDHQFHSFYYDDPLIFTKQCHMLKRGIIANVKEVKDYNKVSTLDEKYQAIFNESIGRISHSSFFIPKTKKKIEGFYGHNTKDSIARAFIFKNFPEIYKMYIEGIQNLSAIENGKWWNSGDASFGHVGVFADFKSLDRNKTFTVEELYPNGYKV